MPDKPTHATSQRADRPTGRSGVAAEPVARAPHRAPLFKGATRLATKWGVPSRVLAFVLLGVLTLALISYWLLLLFPVLYPVLVVISRNDDRAFRIWGLWAQTKFRAPNKRFWGAISFSPTEYSRHRPWCRRP